MTRLQLSVAGIIVLGLVVVVVSSATLLSLHRVKRGAWSIAKTGGKYGWKALKGTGSALSSLNDASMNVFQAVDNFNSVANVFRKRTDADDDQGDQKAMLGNNNQQQLMEQIQGLASGKEEMPKVAAHKEAKVVEEPIHKRYFTEILCVVLFVNLLIFLWFIRGRNSTPSAPSLKTGYFTQEQLPRKRKKSRGSRKRSRNKRRKKASKGG